MKRVYTAPKMELIRLERQVALLVDSNRDGEQGGVIGGGIGLNLESIDKLQDENC